MQFSGPVLVILHGADAAGPAEAMMTRAWAVSARHTATTALAAGFEAVIIATNDPDAFGQSPPGVLVDPDREPFAFLPRLQELARRFGLARMAVMGSGSVPLLGIEHFRFVVEQLASREPLLVTNNFFSSDVTGWTPGSAVFSLENVPRDNVLPRRLRDQAGLPPVMMPRTTATQFDIDTPTDLAALAILESTPVGLRPAVSEVPDVVLERMRTVMRLVSNPTAELVVAGRVSSQAWQYLERETACRVRIISEERGMAAAGPAHLPHSVLGFLLEETGSERFFERIALLGDALLLDARVLEAHLGLSLSREDRFQSDLLNPDAITDPFWREFTAAAMCCPVPVILGGHSLVSGAFMALNDQAWLENDRRLGISP